MRTIAIAFTATLALSLLPATASADDKQEIRQKIPAASAMTQEDFLKMATGAATPKESDYPDKSLSLKLFALKTGDDRSKEQREEFEYSSGIPKPSTLAKEMYRTVLRVPVAPVTMIQAERIKEMTCEVDGDTARGTVTFEVPKLYGGKVEYVAKKKDDDWQVVEFHMPASGIHVLRGEDGKWKDSK